MTYLANDSILTEGQTLVSASKTFFAVMQGDGNLSIVKGTGLDDHRGYV